MSRLLDHFDRIAIISLPEREERRRRLLTNLTATGLAAPEDLTWVEAVDGRKEKLPSWWKQGPGAWGCRFSQLKILKEAQQDQLDSILILEDDAVFHPRASQWLQEVMPALQNDWGQFFLGGEFYNEPTPTANPLLVEGDGITRTHAYAVHHHLYSHLIDIIGDNDEYELNPDWHVDHQFRHHQQLGEWKSYAPAWWLAGQEEGATDISHGTLPRRWWQWGLDFWRLPFIRIGDDHSCEEAHLAFAEAPDTADTLDLAHWFRRSAFEAWEQGRLPACREGSFTIKEIARFWPAGSRTHPDDPSVLANLADYPANGLFDHPFSQIK